MCFHCEQVKLKVQNWGLWSSGLCKDGRTGERGLSGGFEGRI
jgi:hypothetical protein